MSQNTFRKNKPQIPQLAREKFTTVESHAGPRGFTLVEMLVATAVLVLILTMTLQIVNYANTLLLSTRKRIDAFQEARAGFEAMTRKISQATLNTYWDYATGTIGSGTGSPRPAATSSSYFNFVPTQYLRQSDLDFVSGQSRVIYAPQLRCHFAEWCQCMASPVVKILGQSIFFIAPTGYSDLATNEVMPNLLTTCGYFLEFSSDE